MEKAKTISKKNKLSLQFIKVWQKKSFSDTHVPSVFKKVKTNKGVSVAWLNQIGDKVLSFS